jgi:RimJ/RimL family protein N-acetyltransferase
MDAADVHADFRRIRPALEGKLVRLRAREEDDLSRLNELFNDVDVLNNLDVVPFGQSMAGIREWWETTRRSDDSAIFVIETIDGTVVGGCSLENIDGGARHAWLGIWLGQPYWGQGYGTDALRVLCRFGFEHMNLHRISLWCFEFNERARHVYENIGFKLEGTLRQARFRNGHYVDLHVMGLLAGELGS